MRLSFPSWLRCRALHTIRWLQCLDDGERSHSLGEIGATESSSSSTLIFRFFATVPYDQHLNLGGIRTTKLTRRSLDGGLDVFLFERGHDS